MIWKWIEYTESQWRNFDMSLLAVDESYINLLNETEYDILIYYLYENCFKCPYQKLRYREYIKLDGSRSISLKIFKKDQGKYVFHNETSSICEITSYLGEFGVHNLTVSNNNCLLIIDKEPVNIYLPLLTILFIGVAVLILYKLFWYAYQKCANPSEINNSEIIEQSTNKKKRLKSLDIFRGFVISLMIFVNSGGGHYFWVEHAPWNGLHLADVVFPSFLWIMGVAIPFSIQIQLSRLVTKVMLLKNIFVRSFKLFLIGLCLNSMLGPLLENLRIMGVLQRFGITYFFCASIYVIFSKNPIVFPVTSQYKMKIFDIILMREQLVFCVILMIVHLSIIFGMKVPNCPTGYFGPGGIYDYAANPNCTGGATGYIDKLILGENHIYQHSTAKDLYNSKNFDPEGVFGTILSIVQVFLGIQCGAILQFYPCWKARCIRLSIWSLILGVIGGGLCFFQIENGIIPINKNLWSLSYVMTTTAIAFFVLLILYIIVDIKNLWNGYPFLQAGMNPIILYVGHSILHKMLPWHWRIGLMNTHFMLLLESLWNTIIWVLIAAYFYKKNIFYNI